jgi:methionyl-tRNA formyltransferase
MVGGPLKTVFLGTPAFALATLDALLASPHPVVGIVTQPDRPRGRGQRVSESPVKARAVQRGLPVLQPETLKDAPFLDALRALEADIGVVAAYGRLLPEAALLLPRLGMINVHASLLPRYRGAAPVHRAVMSGERRTGVTIMRVIKALDAGPMLASDVRDIGPDETSVDVEQGLAVLGAALLVQTLDAIAAGTSREQPQDEKNATYAPPLRKEEGLVDWTRPAREIHNRIRALHPWPHAWGVLQGRRLVLLRSAVEEAGAMAAPGTVVDAAGDSLRVAAGEGVLRLLEIQPEGRRAMSARASLAGHAVSGGDRFGLQ